MQHCVSGGDLERRAFGSGVSARLFNAEEYGLSSISVMFGEVQPGAIVRLHRHTYEELFVIHQGQASFTIGETTIEARSGDLVTIPAGFPHRFVNTGDDVMRQTAVHATNSIAIEWLE